jgi:hypothetical protein
MHNMYSVLLRFIYSIHKSCQNAVPLFENEQQVAAELQLCCTGSARIWYTFTAAATAATVYISSITSSYW